VALSAQQVDGQLDTGLSSIALLSSSCQAVIEAEIGQVESPWWEQLDKELGEAETLVVRWRRDGVLYFNSEVLDSVSRCATSFLQARSPIAELFAALEQHFDPAGKQQLVQAFQALEVPVSQIASQIGHYLQQLADFERTTGAVQERMETTVAEVQANEVEIEGQIKSINAQIALLEEQIKTDREAISKARSEETTGIVETIFGVIFAPFTGGASLVLAGIGVASIAEGESIVSGMEGEISHYQRTIAGEQTTLSGDQRIVATLKSLTLSTSLVLNDVTGIQYALDALRTTWTLFEDELAGVTRKLQQASDAAALELSKAWYEAACAEWEIIAQHVATLSGLTVTTTRRQIG
jgi:hypothetical protein